MELDKGMVVRAPSRRTGLSRYPRGVEGGRHALRGLLAAALVAVGIAACSGGSQGFTYCYVAADGLSCSCYASPKSGNSVPTCEGAGTWLACCQWASDCTCYVDEHSGDSVDNGTIGLGNTECVALQITMANGKFLKVPRVDSCGAAAGGGAGGSPSTGQCTYKETGTQYASCQKDGDCFSGYCNASCNPGPCCEVATDTVRDDGRSYDCSTDADCEAVAPDLVARGGKASCVHPASTMVHHVCSFTCPNG